MTQDKSSRVIFMDLFINFWWMQSFCNFVMPSLVHKEYLHLKITGTQIVCTKALKTLLRTVLFTSIYFILLVGGLTWTYFSIMALFQIEEECLDEESAEKLFLFNNQVFIVFKEFVIYRNSFCEVQITRWCKWHYQSTIFISNKVESYLRITWILRVH